MNTSKFTAAFTTKVPHHSSHSGYEQLIKVLNVDAVVERPRKNAQPFPWNWLERAARRVSCSRWYMWDGMAAEWASWQFSRRYDRTLVHFLYGDSSVGMLPALANPSRLALLLTVHGCPSDLPEIIQRPQWLRRVPGLILLGENQRSYLDDIGFDQGRAWVIPHGVDLDFFTPPDSKSASAEPFTVLMVGSWRRNFRLYQQVISQAVAETDWRFHVISHAHNRAFFTDFPPDRVRFLHGISDEALRQYYRSAHALLLGLEDAVANNVLLEAMACGLPVVAENVGAISDYCAGSDALLFGANAWEQAFEQLTQLAEDSTLRDRLSSKHLRAAQAFSWNSVARQTHEVYQRLLG